MDRLKELLTNYTNQTMEIELVDLLIADPSKAIKKLNWKPKTSFSELVRIMVEADLAKEEK